MAGSTKNTTSKSSAKKTSSPKKVEEILEEKVEVKEEPVVEIKEEVTAMKVDVPTEDEVQDNEDKIEEKPEGESLVENSDKEIPKECGDCKKKHGSAFCGSCILYPSL